MNMTDPGEVKELKANIEATFNTPQGKKVMEFLEESCGWYESIYDPTDKDLILINAGRREVVATIKTFLRHPPERIAAMAQHKEQDNG